MRKTNEHTLIASPYDTAGRYGVDDEEMTAEISSGQPLAVFLGGQWIEGRVEYASALYSNEGIKILGQRPPEPRVLDGYYFLATGGGICGLMVGMKVRFL